MATDSSHKVVHEWIQEGLGISMDRLVRLELVIAMDDVVYVKTWRQVDFDKLLAAGVPFAVEERLQE